jgi:hypothetical protein
MAIQLSALPSALTLTLALSVCALAHAQTTAPAAAASASKAKAAAVKKKDKVVKSAAVEPPAASSDQIAAAGRVYYGAYACEFNQSVNIAVDAKYPAYVDVQHLGTSYLMKPVVSETGAIRLEDVRGETLMVQIANKSMLLNVKTGHRVVDDCESADQQKFNTTAKAAQGTSAGVAGASMFASPGK